MHSIRAVADSLARDLDGEVTYVHDPFRPTVVLDDRAALHVLGEIGELAREEAIDDAIAEDHAGLRRDLGRPAFTTPSDTEDILETPDFITRHVETVFEALNEARGNEEGIDIDAVNELVALLWDSSGKVTTSYVVAQARRVMFTGEDE